MRRAVGEALGPVEAVKPPPFAIDELYWATRRLQAHEAWAAHGEWISVKATADRPGDLRPLRLRQDRDARTTSPRTTKRARRVPRCTGRPARRRRRAGAADRALRRAPEERSTPEELGAFRERAIRLLCWSGLSGFPQISLPLGTVDGAPFGISLLGPAGSDMALIRLGRRILEAARKG